MTQIDLSSMQPGDAAAALRSFPRRFRDAAHAALHDDDGDLPEESEVVEIGSRPGPDGWSPADLVAACAARLAATHDVVARGLLHDGTTAPAELLDPAPPVVAGSEAALDGALDRLQAVSDSFAATVHGAVPQRWNTTVSVDGRSATLLEVLQRGLAPVVGWLHQVEPLVREVRGHPIEGSPS